MSYDNNNRRWVRLSDALTAVMSAGLTESDAKQLICNGIADLAIAIQLGLRKHSTRSTTAHGKRLSGADMEIPAYLQSQDFDFENSRPIKPWAVAREKIAHLAGYWIIDWIELSRADLTNLTNATKCPNERPPQRRRKTQAAREAARRAIIALYPNGVSDQITESNGKLCQRVGAKLKELKLRSASDDTILRAAGRRK
jgi:hypothetical protein